MTHRLVPHFILAQHAQGARHGRFEAASLFVDISGFSAVTDALMRHGQHGAEVMATLMRTIFDPLVASVFAHGGFITNFAGDAFTALFPTDTASAGLPARSQPPASLRHALAAARTIQSAMTANALQTTPYGDFPFSAKVGLATGTAVWGIVESQDGARAAFYFKGTAVTAAADAEHHARADEIILSPAAGDALRGLITAEAVNDHWRVTGASDAVALPAPQPVQLPPLDHDTAAVFVPRNLIEQTVPGEFRQVINLFISLEGTPSHVELNTFMAQFFTLQERYGGFCNRIDYGDKGCHILLFWGAPTAHENDVARVCNFLLDLREASVIPLRAGITYRIAHAGMIGSALAEEYTCYGRGVNLAARHMVAAGWGEIWVDGDFAQRASDGFTFVPHGRHRFKGFAEEQPVYLLTGRELTLGQIIYQHPLVGREAELAALDHALDLPRQGRSGGVVTVVGEPGIGKSRLIHEFLSKPGVVDSVQVFLCQTDEILRQSLNPFRYFLRQYFAQLPNLSETVNKRAFTAALDDLIAATADDDLRAELHRTRSFLGALVDLRWEGSLYEQLEPQLRFENTLGALKTLIKAESLQQPVVIQLEDAHWLDSDSVDFLRMLTRNIDQFPLLLLITSREASPADWFAPETLQKTIVLNELPDDATAVFSRAILGREPSEALLRLLHERTEGNPFFIEQLLLYLQENDLLAPDMLQATPLRQDIMLPTDVRTLLTARLDRLPGDVKRVVQKAAVLGREFDVAILMHMVAGDAQLGTQLRTAEQEAVWFSLNELRYLFKHALLRDAAYDMQVQSRLQQLHRHAAVAFEETYAEADERAPHFAEIAYHYDRGREDALALRYYIQAADLARDNYQNDAAIVYYGRGLELVKPADADTRYLLLLGREAALNIVGRRSAQAEDLAQLERLLLKDPDTRRQSDVALRKASYALAVARYDEAEEAANAARSFARESGSQIDEAQALQRVGRLLWQQGRVAEAQAPLSEALELAQHHAEPQVVAEILYDLCASALYRSDYEQGIDYLNRARQIYALSQNLQGEIRCLTTAAYIAYQTGNYEDAIVQSDAALGEIRKLGWRYAESHSLAMIGNAAFDLGDFAAAETHHLRALAISREVGSKEAESRSLDTLGLINHYSGHPETAVAFYEEALGIEQEIKNQRNIGYVLTHLGYSLFETGDLARATQVLTTALHIRREVGDLGAAVDTLAGLAAVALVEGRLPEALHYADEILDWLAENDSDAVELPIQVYLICSQVLQAAATAVAGGQDLAQRAAQTLNTGYDLLQARAVKIGDASLRRQFVQNVPYNRELARLWLLHHAPSVP